jgi:hypothetical protein
MDRKSQKLTNILLFIIVCFFVLGALCALWRAAMMHRGFEGKFGGCKMQGQYKNIDKWCGQEWGCPLINEKVDPTNVAE